jgi:hypothetical protein
MDLPALKQAAEEVGFLLSRGYPADAVATFVAEHRKLGREERRFLDENSRLRARYTHHIARELEREDVARRPLKVDAASVAYTLAAALSGKLVVISPAGVLGAPGFSRQKPIDIGEQVLDRLAQALNGLRVSKVRWYVSHGDQAAWAESLQQRLKKLPISVQGPGAVVDELRGASQIASDDPVLLDDCQSWFNLSAAALTGLKYPALVLE